MYMSEAIICNLLRGFRPLFAHNELKDFCKLNLTYVSNAMLKQIIKYCSPTIKYYQRKFDYSNYVSLQAPSSTFLIPWVPKP